MKLGYYYLYAMETLQVEDQNKLPHEERGDAHETIAHQAYNARRADLVRWAAHKLDRGEVVSEGVLRVLIARQIETTLAMGVMVGHQDELPDDSEEGDDYRDIAEVQRDIQERVGLFTPKGGENIEELDLNGIPDDGADPEMDLEANLLKKYSKGLDGEYSLLTLLADGITVAEPELCRRIIQDALRSNIADLDHEVLEALLLGVFKSQEPQASMDLLWHFLNEKRGDQASLETQRIIVEHIAYMRQNVFEKSILALFRSDLKDDDKKYTIQIFLSVRNFADVLNAVRAVVEQSRKHDSIVAQEAESMGRMLIGKDTDVPFMTSLQQVYEAIQFEKYQPNIASTDRDVDLLIMTFGKYHIKRDDEIVELGSGTGRLIQGLVRNGYTHVTGIEESERNIQAALQLAHFDQSPRIVQASWYHTGLESDSIDCIYSLGRSLPHAENREGFLKVFKEARRILKDGSVFYFDMPDASSQPYASALEEHEKRLDSVLADSNIDLNILGPLKMPHDDTVIDSPDGIHWYNRYVPTIDTIRDICRQEGFDLIQVETHDVEGIPGARSHVITCKKQPVISMDSLLSRLATLGSTVPASNVQFADGE